jgi:hypothetical protein
MEERISASCARRWADSAARRRRTMSSGLEEGADFSGGEERREIREGEN